MFREQRNGYPPASGAVCTVDIIGYSEACAEGIEPRIRQRGVAVREMRERYTRVQIQLFGDTVGQEYICIDVSRDLRADYTVLLIAFFIVRVPAEREP